MSSGCKAQALVSAPCLLFFDFASWKTEDLVAAVASEKILMSQSVKGAHPDRIRSYYAGRYALLQALQKKGLFGELSVNPEFGFLSFKNDSGFVFCNVAHADQVAVAALSPSPIGVDIESSQRPAEKVLKRLASNQEIKQLEKVFRSEENPALHLWCAKEAFAKALGLGFRTDPHHFEIDWASPHPFSAQCSLATPLTIQKPAIALLKQSNYLLAACTERALLETPLTVEVLEN